MIHDQARLKAIVSRMRDSGHRLTPQRMAVLKTLIGNREHLSADQIYERVRLDFPMTSLATIYNTINVLKEMGEIRELGFSDGGNRYDGGSADIHPHLICTRCKKIVDVDVTRLDELPQEIALRTGYLIESHRLDFFGICPQCQENAKNAGKPTVN